MSPFLQRKPIANGENDGSPRPRNGNTLAPRVKEPPTAETKSNITRRSWTGMRDPHMGRLEKLRRRSQTFLAFSICTALCGNGSRIGMEPILPGGKAIPPDQQVGSSRWCVGARGSTTGGTYPLRTASGSRPRSVTSSWAIAVWRCARIENHWPGHVCVPCSLFFVTV